MKRTVNIRNLLYKHFLVHVLFVRCLLLVISDKRVHGIEDKFLRNSYGQEVFLGYDEFGYN